MSRTVFKDKEQFNKMWEDATKPVVVNSLHDIKMVLQSILSGNSDNVTLQTEMKWQTDNIKEKTVVTSKSKSSSLRDILLDGMSVVKKRIESQEKMLKAMRDATKNGHAKINMQIWDVDNTRFAVDSLIKQRLGGKRHKCRIRWELPIGTYEFDPFTDKLFQV